MATCRAAVITAHEKPLEIWDVNVPILDPGSVLIKMVASNLCGTDVHRWHGPPPKNETLQAVDFLASRAERYPFDDMISRAYNLKQVNEAMNAMASFEVVKPVINF